MQRAISAVIGYARPPIRAWQCFNPISALTLAILDRIPFEPSLRALCIYILHIHDGRERTVPTLLSIAIPVQMMERR
jgi:hypothetical protein